MNCANHPDRERSAFCQNCGRPLCNECVRSVGGSIFCEPCLAARVAGANPTGYPPTSGATPVYPPAPGTPSQPNPGLAALLGFIPGVGAMYNEQYAKGIVHLIVFALLVSLSHESGIFGLFVAGWIFYMVIEAHHTAKARRDGTPLPNPFGLNDLAERLGFGKNWPAGASNPFTSNPFTSYPSPGSAPPNAAAPGPAAPGPGAPYSSVPPASAYAPPYTYAPPVSHWGAPQDAYTYATPPVPPVPPVPPMPPYVDPNVPYQRRFPVGAIWLIGLGVFFLISNSGILFFPARYLGPFLLIAVGIWLFVRKMTCTGQGLANDGTPSYRWRLISAVNSSFWVLLTGVIWLLDDLHILSWGRSWPIYLIGVGLLQVFKRTADPGIPEAYAPGPYGQYPGGPYSAPPAAPVTGTAIVPVHDHTVDSGSQEGR